MLLVDSRKEAFGKATQLPLAKSLPPASHHHRQAIPAPAEATQTQRVRTLLADNQAGATPPAEPPTKGDCTYCHYCVTML